MKFSEAFLIALEVERMRSKSESEAVKALIVARDLLSKIHPYPNEPEIKQINAALGGK